MSAKEVNQLIEKYLDGMTSPEEEQVLAIYVNQKNAPREWKDVAAMIGELTLSEGIYDQKVKSRRRKTVIRRTAWSMAASIVIATIVSTFYIKGGDTLSEGHAVAYINGHEVKNEQLAIAMAEDAVIEIFETAANSDCDLTLLFEL